MAIREIPCDYVFLPRARTEYNGLEQDDRIAIDVRIDQICLRPDVDNLLTFDLPMPPVMRRLYDDGTWSIAYDVVEPDVVRLFQITRGGRAV